MSFVSLVDSRKSKNIKEAIGKSLALINFVFPKGIQKVVIKPNMCYYWDYTTGETTDPNFVSSLVDLIKDRVSHKTEISIVESDASAMKCKYAFRFLGYEKMAQEKGINLINLSKVETESHKVTVNNNSFYFKTPKILREADLRINIPKIKYHPPTGISCALKNIYGCNPYPKKHVYHPRINEVIVALNKIMRFDLCIVDSVIVLGSYPKKMNLIMASQDQVAVDTVAAKLTGINPKSIKHIMLAEKELLGNTSFVIKGETLKRFEEDFPRKTISSRIMGLGYRLLTMSGLAKRLRKAH